MIIETSFEEVLPIWRDHLWPNRRSPIESHSSIPFMGGCNMAIYDSEASFFSFLQGDQVAGVVSGFKTSNKEYRSRGLFVFPNARREGIATTLLREIEKQAMKEGCDTLWTMPRKTAIDFYTSFGFERVGDWFDEDVEFGPNCFVKKSL